MANIKHDNLIHSYISEAGEMSSLDNGVQTGATKLTGYYRQSLIYFVTS